MEHNNARHFADLSRRAENGGYAVFSDFLGLSEISELQNMHILPTPRLWGGYENAERVQAAFGECEVSDYPITVLKVYPVNRKFADTLSHRDFLGSLMGLGIKREVIGDIIVSENCAYIFVLDTMADYIAENLKDVKHTTVKTEVLEKLPDVAVPVPETEEHIVSSLRLDVLVASVYNLSRNSASELFAKEKVFVNGNVKNASYTVREGDSITVRGNGKFIFAGEKRRTKKDRLVIELKIYK